MDTFIYLELIEKNMRLRILGILGSTALAVIIAGCTSEIKSKVTLPTTVVETPLAVGVRPDGKKFLGSYDIVKNDQGVAIKKVFDPNGEGYFLQNGIDSMYHSTE